MKRETMNRFRALVYDMSGITLGDKKEALVSARIGKRMRALNLETPEDYLRYVEQGEDAGELVQLIDAISTNVTSFFREADHFRFLAEVCEKWRAAGQRRFRLWSAASSSGEEPYSIAMTMLDTLGPDYDVRILATDISTKVLAQATAGVYTPKRLSGCDRATVTRHFQKEVNGAVQFSVRPEVHRLCVFKQLNLSQPPFPMRGPLDAVFCRNVMIYFDTRVRTQLLREIHRLLKPGGYLFVGHAESLTGLDHSFKTVRPSICRKD